MIRRDSLGERLGAIAADLRRAPRAPVESAEEPSGLEAAAGVDLEALLASLGEEIGDVSAEAEDFVAAHPYGALLASFLLGLAVGRLSKGVLP